MLTKQPIENEVEYRVGKFKVKPSHIYEALRECANDDQTSQDPPEEYKGWGLVYGTDEFGKTVPLFIMRTLPGNNIPTPYHKVIGDDISIAEILTKDIYGLTTFKVWKIRTKYKIRNLWRKIFK